MEMHQLRYVVAVARAGNFSRAAEQCHVSQPSLSQQVQKLEEELGERLFHRMARAAKLTPVGEAFLRRATRILEEVDAAQREAQDARALLHGTLAVGVLPTIAPYVLPDVVSAFARRFPGVELSIQEDTTARVVRMALACEIDVAIASLPLRDERLEVQELFVEELLLALPPGHPLARKRSVSAADLEKEKFIVMKEGHCLGEQVLHFCERRDVNPNVSFRSAQLETIQALVRTGMGVSLIPELATRERGAKGPVYRRLPAPHPQRTIIALWPRQRPPGRGGAEFLEIISSRFGKGRS
jgi:LysR family transcriptional regulator, hydrogen peroxide-inducible genes activator